VWEGKAVREVLFAVAWVMAIATPVEASDKADVMEIAQRWTDAFNGGGFNTDNAPCAEDAVVIDDLQPHVWQGSGACSRWYKAVMSWAATAAVTNATIALGKTRHLDFDARYAYLVAPVTLADIRAEKPVDFPGIITMTLRKGESGWRVSGLAWADQWRIDLIRGNLLRIYLHTSTAAIARFLEAPALSAAEPAGFWRLLLATQMASNQMASAHIARPICIISPEPKTCGSAGNTHA
jgi:hypothetical protein